MVEINSRTKPVRFHSYPSTVQTRLIEYDDFKKQGDDKIKEIFEELITDAEEKYNRPFSDNKVAFEFNLHGHIVYLGYKDGIYALGLDLYQIEGKVFNFNTETTTYIKDDKQ